MYFLVPISYCYIFIEYMWFKKKKELIYKIPKVNCIV